MFVKVQKSKRNQGRLIDWPEHLKSDNEKQLFEEVVSTLNELCIVG
jgi:hypothetical protein